MTHFATPAQPLTDGVVTLRLASVAAGDVGAVLSYIEQEQLDGGWLPEMPLVSAEQAIGDWRDARAARPSPNGPTFVVIVPGEPRFTGIVGLVDRGEGTVEMIYVVAPRWRGRGLASRAVRLAARSVASQPGVSTVELWIGQDLIDSQHVAANAGFVAAGTVTQFIAGTRESFEDLRYVLEWPSPRL